MADFIVTKRNYHGEEAEALIRWVVHRPGELRGVCECWDEETADRISAALNGSLASELMDDFARLIKQIRKAEVMCLGGENYCASLDKDTVDELARVLGEVKND